MVLRSVFAAFQTPPLPRHGRKRAVFALLFAAFLLLSGGNARAQGTPDLVVQGPNVSDYSLQPSEEFLVVVTVRNRGDGESAATTVRFYHSTDEMITTSDTSVGMHRTTALVPSERYGVSISLTAPATPGTYYYGACVDAVPNESVSTNNCSTYTQVTVSAIPPTSGPDLTVYVFVRNPSVSPGSPLALLAGVLNDGDMASAATTLRYYRSTDVTVTTSDTAEGTDTVEALAASEGRSEGVSLTAPSTTGTYYYGACVDAVAGESDTTNNCSPSVEISVLQTQQQSAPDLVVLGPNVSDSSPETGGTFWLIGTVTNQGDGQSAATTVRYLRSTDATITTSDTEEGTDAVRALVSPQGYAATIRLTAPSTAGTYYYGACVDAVADESDTGNNCSDAVSVTVGGGGGTPRTSLPSAVRNLMVAGGNGEVVLTWDAPSSDGGAEITDYEYRIDRRNPWISTGSTETTYTVTGLDNGTAYTFEVRAVNKVGKGRGSNRTEATPVAPEVLTLDFTHFANGDGTTSDLVFVNVASQPVRPALYFYDTEGALVSAESVVDITGDLAIQEDGALTVLTEIEPLGELTISTHGQGDLVSGSVKVVSDGPIGGMLRFDLPAIGEAVVGASPPISDAIFPVRRQEGGITTGVAVHNLEEEAIAVMCELMQEGVLRDSASIPLEANGQTSWLIDQAFPGTDTSDFVGSVRCDAVGEGRFSAVALELDAVNRIFTTLPVVPVPERMPQE